MHLTIFSTAAEQIAAHARRDAPHEACGLLLGTAERIEMAVATPNVAADPATAFEIDPRALLRLHREARSGGTAVIGCYHSHPGGGPRPSAVDAARAVEAGKIWLIATAAGLCAFVAAPGGSIEGRFDAVELMLLPPDAVE